MYLVLNQTLNIRVLFFIFIFLFCPIARRRFCTRFDIHSHLVKIQFERGYRSSVQQVNDQRPGPSRRRLKTDEKIQRVESNVRKNPRQSVRKRASALTLSKTTLHRILTMDMNLKNKNKPAWLMFDLVVNT